MEVEFLQDGIKISGANATDKFIVNGIEYGPIPKPEIKKPEWKDFGELQGYYVSGNAEIIEYGRLSPHNGNRNTWPTKEEAEAALALSQLLQWRNKYNEGPVQESFRYGIGLDSFGDINIGDWDFPVVLALKDRKTAERFLNDFRDLIIIAKPLL